VGSQLQIQFLLGFLLVDLLMYLRLFAYFLP
jgi:hypothetical protein